MAAGVIKAMLEDKPFPADGEAAWNELLFEAAVHRSALRDGERMLLAEVERDVMKHVSWRTAWERHRIPMLF